MISAIYDPPIKARLRLAPAPAQIVNGLRLQPKNLGSATLCSSINFSLIYCPPIFKILPLDM